MPKSSAQKRELNVPRIDNGPWTPHSFGWYIHQSRKISDLLKQNESLAAEYLVKVVQSGRQRG